MSRIRKAYAVRFTNQLATVRARRLNQGVRWLNDQADLLATKTGMSEADALTRVYKQLVSKRPFQRSKTSGETLRFFCDAGLGGLARWLRAAGYEALWEPHIEDEDLIQRARKTGTTILTTDSMLMERRLLRDGVLPALWLPPTLRIAEQLATVFREFALMARQPRCMSCGGGLVAGDKEALRARIPPRTYRWLNDYFVCSQCGKLFWHGTHWRRIQERLRQITGPGEKV